MLDRDATHILITDIGSTSTKAILLERENGRANFLAEASVPTTVEMPSEDVKIGVRQVAEQLEEQTGVQILDDEGALTLPYLTTSSAGGGLQMIVFGLSSVDTGKAAKLTAHAAGGVILGTFTIDDSVPTIHKMRMIRDLHPDMILLAGGVEGGNIASLVRLAEILSLAEPTPKFSQAEKLPLVFCGNSEALRYIGKVLGEKFELHQVENIRPTLLDLNPEPARDRVLKLFMENVMERAPGYAELKNWTAADILPTPTAVERILRLYVEATGENIVMTDIGGATTDVFSNIFGDYRRTVAANTGVSYSICNILAEAGYPRIAAHLPESAGEAEVRDYIAGKMLRPDTLPRTALERRIEQAAATEGIAIAWDQHRETNFSVAKLGMLDRLKMREDFDPFEEVFWGPDLSFLFQVADVQTLVGTGGVIANAENPMEALRMLADGFKPSGITKIAIDRGFRSPHMGVLASEEPELALDLFRSECLQEIAFIVAPIGKVEPGKPALALRDTASGESLAINGNEVRLMKSGSYSIESLSGLHIEKLKTTAELATDYPILFDCRGRGKHFIGSSLGSYGLPEFACADDGFADRAEVEPRRIEKREYSLRRSLPYEGEIFVSEGDSVEPDTLIGENVFSPPRIYIVDMQRIIGYENELSDDEIASGILVKVGDKVNAGQKMFRFAGGMFGDYTCNSPVRGEVTQIEAGGLVIMREIQDYSRKPVVVKVAEKLGLDAKRIKRHLSVELGDFIQRDEEIARSPDRMLPLRSPTTGTLRAIDTEAGTVTLQYDIEPVPLRSFVRGTVKQIDPLRFAEIAGEGSVLTGAIGFGSECVGEIHTLAENETVGASDRQGKILVACEPIDVSFLRACAEAKVAGIIAPSLGSGEWVDYHGRELGVALTGDEDIPFTLVLTEGFGRMPLNPAYRDFLSTVEGRTASLRGRTQIRAGAIRPLLIVYD